MDGITGRLAFDTAALRARLESLTRQSATGMRSDRLGDLAPEAPQALTLGAEVKRREAYGRALDQALGRTAVAQGALNRLGAIAREFGAQVARTVTASDPHALDTLAPRARGALAEVAALLNTRHAGEFVFAGADFANPPVVGDPAAGPLAAAVAGRVAALGPGNAGAVLAAIRADAGDPALSPFSAHLEGAGAMEAARSVPSGDGEAIAFGVFANRNTQGVASPPPSAGGWARDLIGNLLALAALTPAQQAQGQSFDRLVAGIGDGLRSAESALADEQGLLGLAERRISEARVRHEAVSTVLSIQVAGLQEADLAETLSRMQATRTALEASYRAVATLGELTLARFLR